MAFLFALAFAAFFASSLSADIPEAQQRFYDVNTQLCGIGIKQWFDDEPKVSQVSSAFPLILGFIEHAVNAKEEYQKQILDLLKQNSTDEALTVAAAVLANLNAKNDIYSATLAFKAFADSDNKFTDGYKTRIANNLNGTVENIDYSDGSAVAASIKSFLEADDSDTVIQAANFTKGTGLTLATRLELNFNFAEEEGAYRPYKKVDIDFTSTDGTTSVQSGWYSEGAGKYAKIDNVEVFQFALKGGLPVLLFLPATTEDFKTFVSSLTDPAYWANILTQLKDKTLKLNIPVLLLFKDIRDYVPEVKRAKMMESVFDKNSDVFTGVYEHEAPGYIEYLFNRLIMKFSESTMNETKEAAPDTIFNRPFAYTLMDQYNTPVIIGMKTN